VVLAVPRPRDAQSDGGHCRSEARFRPASDAPVPRLGDHLRWRIAGVSRAGRRARTDQKRRREIGRGAHWQEPTPPVGRVAAAVGIRPAGWLRGCERRRSVVPRSGDALGGRRQSAHRSGCLSQPDGPLRDRMAGRAGKPRRSCRSAGPMDRRGAPAASAAGRRARYGFEREPDLRRTGRQRLQWAFRLHLLSSAVRVQPARRSGAVRPALGQRAQRR